jgi:hypothetical protein
LDDLVGGVGDRQVDLGVGIELGGGLLEADGGPACPQLQLDPGVLAL